MRKGEGSRWGFNSNRGHLGGCEKRAGVFEKIDIGGEGIREGINCLLYRRSD